VTSAKVILPYVQRAYAPPPLEPEDAKHAAWVSTMLEDGLVYLTKPKEDLHFLQEIAAYFAPKTTGLRSPFEGCNQEEVLSRMEDVYIYMDDRLTDRDFIGGQVPGMADAVLFQHVADALALVDHPVTVALRKHVHLIMFFRRVCNR